MGKKEKEVQISTLLGQGSEISGDFTAQGSARIDGDVDGNVTVTGTLIVGATGSIAGNISAKAAIVGGEVIGNITAPEKTELAPTARVFGDIATTVIVIDEKAIFQGRCDMNQDVSDKKNRVRSGKVLRENRKSAKSAIAEALKEVEEESAREAQNSDGEMHQEGISAL